MAQSPSDKPEALRALMERPKVILPDPVPPHPLLEGKREIGRGEFSIVLDKGDSERVYKIVSSPADYFLHTADDRPSGDHFPVVHQDHGIIGRAASGYTFHLLEMEKLYPLQPGSEAAVLALQLIDLYWRACQQWRQLGTEMGRIALHHVAVSPLGLAPDVQSALKSLADFVDEYQVRPDLLNPDNLMMRTDGTLVFSDPVFIA